jgi:glycosyltransferase involved in cell wall biosynthesis
MKLLIITQYFPPEMGAPQARLYELAKRLKNLGYEITVLTGLPNYPTGRIFDEYRGKVRTTENVDGIKVVRTWLYPSKSKKLLPRLLSYISFAVTCLLIGVWELGKQDVVLIESPPLFLVPSALIISRITRGRPVMMVADIWPDIIIRMGCISERSIFVKGMLWLEKFCYTHSSAVALTTPGMCNQIRSRFPQLPNVTIISNGVDTSLFRPELRDQAIRSELGVGPNDFLAGYCGLHGLCQGLEVVLKVAAKLRHREDIRFIMVGDGPTKETLVKMAAEMKLPNLRFLDKRPKKEIPPLLASLEVSLMPLAIHLPGAMPSKVYEALASGAIPIVAKGSDAELLVSQNNAGLSYEPENTDELAQAILKLADDRKLWKKMQENGLHLAKRFDQNILAQRAANILAAVSKGEILPPTSW